MTESELQTEYLHEYETRKGMDWSDEDAASAANRHIARLREEIE